MGDTVNDCSWVEGITGNFAVPVEVANVLPDGSKLVSAEKSGISAWTRTAKLTVVLSDGTKKRFFLKCITGTGARALVEGEYHSAAAINTVVPNLCPSPHGWGTYRTGDSEYYFFIGDFLDMDLDTAPEPDELAGKLADLHRKSVSPTEKFGFSVPTVIGIQQRTVCWESSWAACFANMLGDVLRYDRASNGPWDELEAASAHLIKVVVPRLLEPLQSEGRSIKPSLIHGDLWEGNVGISMETGDMVIFDPGSVYAHNEAEFGTWRCSWAFQFSSPQYLRHYQRLIEPSEPAEQWDDRNRLYSIHAYMNDSAGHPGSHSRKLAYNDILYLCEKYAPLDSLEKYDPKQDLVLTGGYMPFVVNQLA